MKLKRLCSKVFFTKESHDGGPSSILAQLLCLLNVKNSNICERESDTLYAILYIYGFRQLAQRS